MGTGNDMQNVEVFVAVYKTEAGAQATLDQIKKMEDQGTLDIVDAATIERAMDGKVKVHHRELSTKTGAGGGAVVGAVLGAIFPPSIIVSALGAGVIGAVVGHFGDKNMSNAELKKIGDQIQPGQAGVIAIVQDKAVQQLATALTGYDKLYQQSLGAEMSGELVAVVDKATGEGAVGMFVQEQTPPMDASGSTTSEASSPA
jgi:uncharacterized membrane protein